MKKRLLLATFGLALISTAALAEDEIVPRFDISSIRLQGNTLLTEAEVDKVFAAYLGSQKDFGTLQEAIYYLSAFSLHPLVHPRQGG